MSNKTTKLINILAAIICGYILGNLFYLLIALLLGRITAVEYEAGHLRLMYAGYFITTFLIGWYIMAMPDEALQKIAKNLPPLTRLQLALIVAVAWPPLTVFAILLIITGQLKS